MTKSNPQKIFVIGFQKTGTTSLGKALEILGYKVCGVVQPGDVSPESEKYREKLNYLLDIYNAFQDNPWCIIYKELDKQFPGSKFILTLRPTDEWILSVVNHFGTTYRPLNEWIYGVAFPQGNEHIFAERYDRHNSEVQEYFSSRPNDLLVMNGEYSWERLCRFLGKPKPAMPFPHANKSSFPLKNKFAIRLKNFILRK